MPELEKKVEYKAWAGYDPSAADGNLKEETVQAKTPDDDDIDVKILYCGLCGSDPSALAGGILPYDGHSMICGHEIVGEVTAVGSKVDNCKVGDIVGVGAQCDSCRTCEWCEDHEEEYCPELVFTFGMPYQRGNAKGERSIGGFAKRWRGPSRFAIQIPKALDISKVGPWLCGGITVYSPLYNNGAGTTAKRVGILGVGGLGHMAIMLAKAMGAEVTAISRGDTKKEDALKLGASKHIATGKDLASDFKGHEKSLDLIISTINPSSLPVNEYLSLLRPKGRFIMVGLVPKIELDTQPLIFKGTYVGGSPIGSPDHIRRLLDLVAKHKLEPWVQKYDMDDINKSLVDYKEGKARYRYVLVNTDQGGKM